VESSWSNPDSPLRRDYPETIVCPDCDYAFTGAKQLPAFMPVSRDLTCFITLRPDKCRTEHAVRITVHSLERVHFALFFVKIARDLQVNPDNV
jgi:hypothetical protein